jgi:hypothetical protein
VAYHRQQVRYEEAPAPQAGGFLLDGSALSDCDFDARALLL